MNIPYQVLKEVVFQFLLCLTTIVSAPLLLECLIPYSSSLPPPLLSRSLRRSLVQGTRLNLSHTHKILPGYVRCS